MYLAIGGTKKEAGIFKLTHNAVSIFDTAVRATHLPRSQVLDPMQLRSEPSETPLLMPGLPSSLLVSKTTSMHEPNHELSPNCVPLAEAHFACPSTPPVLSALKGLKGTAEPRKTFSLEQNLEQLKLIPQTRQTMSLSNSLAPAGIVECADEDSWSNDDCEDVPRVEADGKDVGGKVLRVLTLPRAAAIFVDPPDEGRSIFTSQFLDSWHQGRASLSAQKIKTFEPRRTCATSPGLGKPGEAPRAPSPANAAAKMPRNRAKMIQRKKASAPR